jgi:hypothetical protein
MCGQSISRTLDEVLQELEPSPEELLSLPIAHLTTVNSFENIVNNGGILIPSFCNVFRSKMLYFSYGGIFHRHRQEPTSDKRSFPVAVLFSPRLIERMNCFFAYDTGAAYHQRYHSWSSEFCQFEKYRIPNNHEQYRLPSKLVYHTYGSNQNYLDGEVISEDKPILQIEPLQTLLSFLRDDMSCYNVDNRQRSIECQTSDVISLKIVFDDILWIGLPVQFREQFNKLCNFSNPIRPPAHYFYKASKVESCYAIARMLQEKAREEILQPRYLDFGVPR